jgi:hypothetical protein
MSVLLLAMPALAAGAPLSRCLGPSARRIERALAATLVAGALAGPLLILTSCGRDSLFIPSFALPPHGTERSKSIFAIAASGRTDAAGVLFGLTASLDPRDRRDAIIALARFSGPEVMDAMRAASMDRDVDVRRAAAASLGFLEGDDGIGILLSIIDADADMRVVREANSSLERRTGYAFRAGSPAAPLGEGERKMAAAFWRHALYLGHAVAQPADE